MAYVPWQYFTTVYETDKALEVGTIFPELDRPFLAAGRCGRA
ncbi:MAG: spore coat associated protein CotJA [Clostridiales bacterium]|nr:spore coat associated protein CotJA [Clostridiales bacterium]